mmetsp:Transcript_77405/g.196679  ORF Transcript_77405/g.196679 Transcript_77405/m.196679 type:complete len:358 (+) Transcript_77405:878-1951(+)
MLVLEDDGQGDVALGQPLQTSFSTGSVGHDATNLGGRELVIVHHMFVDPLETSGLVKSCATFRCVLPPVEDGFSLLLLEDAFVSSLGKLRAEPIIVCVLLDLLQRDDVCSHRLQLFQDQVFPPCPRQRPLLAIGVDRLCGIQISEHVPVHDLELLAQPLGIESPSIANHPACPRFLGCGDDRACGDSHPTVDRVSAVLEEWDDVEAQRPVDVLLAWAVRPSRCDLHPLGDRLLDLVLIGFGAPHVLRKVVPTSQEALLRAIALEGLGHISYHRHLVRVEKARFDDWPPQPAVSDTWAAAFVFKESAVLVAQSNVDRHLRDDDWPVSADEFCSHHRDRRLLLIITPGTGSAAAGSLRV